MGRSKRQIGPIGLDLDRGVIHAAQTERAGGAPRLAASARIERANPEKPIDGPELSQIAQALERQGFVGRACVVAAPQDIVKRSMFDLPPQKSGIDTAQFTHDEFASTHDWPSDAFELASWELPAPTAGSHKRQALAAGARHHDTDRLARLTEDAGFEAIGLDLRCWALARACSVGADSERVSVILDFAWDCASLIALHQREVIYERAFSIAGLGALVADSKERLDIDPHLALVALLGLADDANRSPASSQIESIVRARLESLAYDLRTALSFIAHRYDAPETNRLFLTGRAPVSTSRAATHLGLAPGIAKNGASLASGPEVAPELACAVGLSLWRPAA